jgi:hypothetical protein
MSVIKEFLQEVLKSDRDKTVIVYHVSPELSLTKIMPRHSKKFNDSGVFVSSSLQSIFNSWAQYVASKKSKDVRYENVAIYTLRIPRSFFNASEQYHEKKYEESDKNLGSWGWDVETFVPEHLIPKEGLIPSSTKVYNIKDIEDFNKNGGAYWKLAGRKPKEVSISYTKRNPARQKYKELKEKILASALKRGGRIGISSDNPKELDPQSKVQNTLFKDLQKLALKKELTKDEVIQLKSIEAEIEELIDTQSKQVQPSLNNSTFQKYPSFKTLMRKKYRKKAYLKNADI